MIDAPIALAFAAGLIATINPCGFAMLPAYLGFFVGHEDSAPGTNSAPSSVPRALAVGAVASGGFLLVFASVGTLFSLGIQPFIRFVPWASLVIGVGVLALGIAMLGGFRLRVSLPQVRHGETTRRLRSIFVFGVSYAVASLSCTLPVFLTVVSDTVTRSNFVSGLVAFIAYGLGMSLVLVVLTLAVALARDSLVRNLKRATRYTDRAGGVLLVLAGTYLVYYWIFNLSTRPGTTTGAGPARWVEDLSFRLANWIDDFGSLRLGILLVGLLLGAITYVTTLRLLRPRPDGSPSGADGGDESPGRPREVDNLEAAHH
jgi:cytochrome c-type biogenesis protein